MLHRFPAPAVLVAGALMLSGCAGDSPLGPNAFTTSALTTPPPADPACVTLASEIDGLRKEGVADKIEKAAAKKYKMTAADLVKADKLTKANADFQGKCSTLPAPKPATAQGPVGPPQPAPQGKTTAAAKAVPATAFAAPAAKQPQ